jgi:hypothetical protein
MTVAQLKAELKSLPDDLLVVMSRDSEGNGFSPLSDVADNARYEQENAWSGEIRLKELTPDLKERGYTEDDVADENAPECIVLWP